MSLTDTLNSVLTGSILSGGADSNAQNNLDQITGAYNGITAPTLTPEQLQLYSWLQNVMPQNISAGADVKSNPVAAAQAATALTGPSAMQGIQDNPALMQQQQASLGALQDLAAHGGMNQADQANLNNIQNQALQASRGQQDAIMQSMASRGMDGSGNELLARLSASQNATNQMNNAGLSVAGQAQARALQAMMQGGQLAGQMQGQQFGEAAQKAAAQDAISKFNAQNANMMNQYNTGATNHANEFNSAQQAQLGLANRQQDLAAQQFNANVNNQAQYYNNQGAQNVANQNTGLQNQETYYNQQQLPMINYQNQVDLAGRKAGVAQTGLDYWNDQSSQQRQGFQNLMQGAIGGATTAGKNYNQYGSVMGQQQGQNANGSWQSGYGPAAGGAGGAEGSGMMAGGDLGGAAMFAARGGVVPGTPHVHGNSLANDTVPARLSPGEVVLPRSVTQSSHPMKAAQSFLHNLKTAPILPTGGSKLRPEDITSLLKSLNPKHQLNSDLYKEKEQETEPDVSSKLAALRSLAK